MTIEGRGARAARWTRSLRWLLLGAILALAASGPAIAQGDPGAPQIALQTLTTGLDKPIDITHAGDGSNRLFIAQQNGIVKIYDLNASQLLATPFIDISSLIAPGGDPVGDFEGLLGIAFHPHFEVNGRFFLSYVTTDRVQFLARFSVSADPNVANPPPDAVLLMIAYSTADFPHYGGQIQFGPDGYLYLSTGDGGETGGLPVNFENAQDLSVLLGKLLRIDVDSGNPYAIPATNPFVGTPNALPEIWARGLRNPWRFSFDRMTGELFLTDVGDSAREEVNVQPAAGPGGENYGWSRMEGSLCFSPATNCNDGTLVLPTFEYAHTQDACSGSISGGYRYRGSAFPQLTGMYIFSDFCRHDVRGAFQLSDGSWKQMLLLNLATAFPPIGFNIVGFGEDEAGEIYVGGFFEHKVFRLTASDNPVPVLTSIAPDTGTAGSGPLTLVVTGSSFKVNSAVRWDGSDRTTLFVSDTELHASLSAGDLANAGSFDVTVFTPPNGGGESSAVPFALDNPAPTLTSLNPPTRIVGGPDFALTLSGSGFVSSSLVRWNGADRPTTFVSGGQLTADIPASDIAATGLAEVSVFTPGPGGGVSNALSLPILNPLPFLASLSPNAAAAGASGFTLTVVGTGFLPVSVVRWNGADRPTNFVNGTELTADIPASDIASLGTAQVRVFNPAPGGGLSNALTFTTTVRNPLPTVTGLAPTGVVAGNGAFTLSVTGSNFVSSSVVRWNGSDRITTFVGSGHLQATIPAGDVSSPGTANVTVFSPGPGGGTSNTKVFNIQNSSNLAPSTSLLSPSSVTAGATRDTLTVQVNGSNFVSGSVVRWNGANRLTTFVHAGRVDATIPASDLLSAGTAQVTVFTPVPGGGTSNAQTFTINNPLPILNAISPASAPAGEPGLILTVTGSNLLPGSVVRWNGSNRPTTYIGNSQLRADIPASDLAMAGSASVTVFTAAPGGGESAPQTFTINPVAVASSQNEEDAPPAGSTDTEPTEPANEPAGAGGLVPAVGEAGSEPAGTDGKPGTGDVRRQAALGVAVVGHAVALEVPVLEALEPETAAASNGKFILKVRGKNFLPGAVVRWNGKQLRTTYSEREQLLAEVPASLAATPGIVRITVVNLGSESVESQPLEFAVR